MDQKVIDLFAGAGEIIIGSPPCHALHLDAGNGHQQDVQMYTHLIVALLGTRMLFIFSIETRNTYL